MTCCTHFFTDVVTALSMKPDSSQANQSQYQGLSHPQGAQSHPQSLSPPQFNVVGTVPTHQSPPKGNAQNAGFFARKLLKMKVQVFHTDV